jgi:micrococcal nuclease
MKTKVIIGIALAIVGILSSIAFIGTSQITQINQGIEKVSPQISSQFQNEPTKSESKIEPAIKKEPVQTEPEKVEPVKTEPSINCSGNAECITGMVTKVVDGDTLDIDGIRIRISLTNTPERDYEGFSEATEFTTSLCPIGSTAHVDQDDLQPYDKFGRMLGKVTCSDKVLNSELLYNNFATISSQYCSTSEFSNDSWAQQYGCATKSQMTTQIPKEIPEPSSNKNNCDPSYPDFCIQPSPPDLDCKDIPQKRFTVLPPDPHRFDGDEDGIGCES